MVDVAFLLLTFFVLSATISNLSQIEVVKPPKCDGPHCGVEVEDKKVLTLILDKTAKVYYYLGSGEEGPGETNFSSLCLRRVILDHLQQPDPILVIKSQPDALYQSLVDVLDEIEICQVKKYALAPFTATDKEWLAFHTDSKHN